MTLEKLQATDRKYGFHTEMETCLHRLLGIKLEIRYEDCAKVYFSLPESSGANFIVSIADEGPRECVCL